MLDKIHWVWDRWKIMDHPREEAYRIRQQLQYHVIDRLWYAHPPIKKAFAYDMPMDALSGFSVEGLQKVISGTENIKKFKLLNVEISDITNNNHWNYDFKNGIQGQRKFVHLIDDFNYDLGEIKYVYELSRLYQVPVLAAYAIAVKDNRLLKSIEKQLYNWYEQNPFLGTTAWKSGNVVGIRAVNLVTYRMLLQMAGVEWGELDALLNPLIELHYKFLISHLSLYSSKGNHHIGELAGVIAICVAYKFPNATKVLHSCLLELEAETLRLIHKDGFNREQATRYQASYINLIMVSFRLAKLRGFKPSDEVTERIKQMYVFLESFRIAPREFFHVGDDDNAELIYPYFDKKYNVYESMQNDAVVLFGFSKEAGSHFDLRNYILWGDEGLRKYETAQKKKLSGDLCKLYENSGYFVVRDIHVSLLFDVGNIGLLPTMCHGHSDILSLILYIDKTPILVGCGSYQYNAHYQKMRNYFHGVHSHNTISVDGLDQAVPSNGMFWLSYPETVILDYSEDESHPMCTAQHNGYNRPNLHVTHQRKVEYNKEKKEIWIYDTLLSEERHDISFYLHFHPDVLVKHEEDKLIVNEKVILRNPLFKQGLLAKGNEEQPLGWYSKRYDAIEPACSFVSKVEIIHPLKITTCIKF